MVRGRRGQLYGPRPSASDHTADLGPVTEPIRNHLINNIIVWINAGVQTCGFTICCLVLNLKNCACLFASHI